MKIFFKASSIIFILSFIIFNPFSVFTQKVQADLVDETKSSGGLVPCGNEKVAVNDTNIKNGTAGDIVNPCNFDYFLHMINIVVNFILFKLAVPLAALSFAYAGFLLLFSGGQSSERTKAKGIFMNVAIGLVLIAASWLIINSILSVLGYDGSWIGFK